MKNIKSTHIIETIFSYTDDILKYKLFSYSKKFQKQLNIGLLDYQVKFFKMNSSNIYFKYLCFDPYSEYNFNKISGTDNIDFNFNKEGKTELLKKDLLKYNINIDDFKNYVKNYIIKYKEKFIKDLHEEYLIKKNEKDKIEYKNPFRVINEEIKGFQEFSEGIKLEIDINSPLFDIFYKTKLFGELFIIPIDFEFIERYKLKEDFINEFNKLNDINSNYSSLYLKCRYNKDISYLRDFNINFNKIKNLNIKIDNVDNKFDFNLFYKELFSLKDIENNVIDLYINNNIYYNSDYRNEIDEKILEYLNKFKKLENLKLNRFKAKNIFELKIKTLKTLDIDRCENIYINSDTALSLKKLAFSKGKISESLLKLPQLEYLEASDFSSIDFNSLNNLKKIKISANRVTKILSIQSLKEIDIDDYLVHDLDLASIHHKNPSVNKLIYRYIKDDDYDYDPNYNINEILNKFPNLAELIFYSSLSYYGWSKFGIAPSIGQVTINLKENSSCKINKISLFLHYGDIQVYCENFENLEKFEIGTYKILNISDSIPMFSNNRNIIYNSLKDLNLYLEGQLINLEIFKNFNHSIDNMPNLEKIELRFKANIDRNTYEEFIKKILSLKLESINIDLFDDDTIERYFNNNNYDNYSLEELKKINKNILCFNYEKIKIRKYPIVNNSKIKKD